MRGCITFLLCINKDRSVVMLSEQDFIALGFDSGLIKDFFTAVGYVDISKVSVLQFNNILKRNLNCINNNIRSLLVYMYRLYIGELSIDTDNIDQLCKHLRNINKHVDRITLNDLEVSYCKTGVNIPQYIVIGGLKDTDFAIYDKEFLNARGKEYIKDSKSRVNLLKYKYLGVFNLSKQTQTKCYFTTKLKPVLKYKSAREIPDKIGIEKVNKDGTVDVWVSKNYCRLLNRYVIYASLKKPEFYIKILEIITLNGTRLYIYAQNIYTKRLSSYNSNNLRIYGHGIYGDDIDNKLKNIYKSIQTRIPIYKADLVDGNTDFQTLS